MRHATALLRRLALASSAAPLLLVSAVTAVEASPESRRLTREAYDLAYDLRLKESLALLSRARAIDPADPAPARAVAGVTWMQILCTQGVATFAAFEGTATGDIVARPAVPDSLRARFIAEIEQAIALAERARSLRHDDIDARYELGASVGRAHSTEGRSKGGHSLRSLRGEGPWRCWRTCANERLTIESQRCCRASIAMQCRHSPCPNACSGCSRAAW